jgi:hypothetical protein
MTSDSSTPANPAPRGRGHQRTGLGGEHLEVVRDRVVARLGPHGLPDLPGDQPLEGLRLDAHRLRSEVGQQVRRAGEEQVTGEDRDAVGPPAVGAGRTAPDGGLVHDVVVVQRGEVGQLAHDGRLGHPRRPRIPQLGGEQGEHRAEALAAGGHEVTGRLADERVLAADRGAQRLLDPRQAVGERRAERALGEPRPDR